MKIIIILLLVVYFATFRSSPDNIFHENGCKSPNQARIFFVILITLIWTAFVLATFNN